MRFVTTFVTGIAVGYFLHTKKDKTIDQIAVGLSETLNRWSSDLQERATTIAH